MMPQARVLHDDLEDLLDDAGDAERQSEADLWFLPGPTEGEPDELPPGPRAEPGESSILAGWTKAEAGLAARLACARRITRLLEEIRILRGEQHS